MSETSHTFSDQNIVRSPDIAVRASRLVTAIEQATPDQPASLNVLSNGNNTLPEVLDDYLKQTDELYAQHDQLFFEDGLPKETLDYIEILGATKTLLRHSREQAVIGRSGRLGLAVLQFSTAAARISHDPSLATAQPGSSDSEMDEKGLTNSMALIEKHSATVAEQTFTEAYAERLVGNILKLPYSRLSYLGSLVHTHLAFWRQTLEYMPLPQDFRGQAEQLLVQFSAKDLLYDFHSYKGRPDRSIMRNTYVKDIQAFNDSLQSGKSAGTDVTSNVQEGLPFVQEALATVASTRQYKFDECLRIVVRNSVALGKVVQRSSINFIATLDSTTQRNKPVVRLQESTNGPLLSVDYPEIDYSRFAPADPERLQRRDRMAGICPARYVVEIPEDGETHEHLKIFSAAMIERLGVNPPIIRQAHERIYVDPAALLFNYLVLHIAQNKAHVPDLGAL